MKFLKPFGTQNFVLGIGIAAATYLLGPTLKRNARNVAVKGMQGALSAGGMASQVMDDGKEKMSGLVENMSGQRANQEMAMIYNELREEREELKELLTTVKELQQEVADIKNETE
ncbi:hypothetical protein MWH25_02695 [Natroniella acetigena]|uniref:hypothetical protein n=1 Tax=Natroniella acetigena TaxID=52004 RepID=UPI00200AAC9A|nr:hypothetical protein [Natroniella acetigena]MCK8826658.1 hypothetical protein [Natroniella acetigena]